MIEIFIFVIAALLIHKICVNLYFKGEKFIEIKTSIEKHIGNCNDLNEHIEILKRSYSDVSSFDYGEGLLTDTSNYNMKRKNWSLQKNSNRIHNCSSLICKNAKNHPFKYLCKYFSIEINEDTLAKFEGVLNDFSAAEQGKILLKNEREAIVFSIGNSIPEFIIKFEKTRLLKELGFNEIDLNSLYFPVYTFQYISSGGNSSSKSEIRLDVQNLDGFINYLSNLMNFKNSAAGQRALMTTTLREKIKTRDSHTCKSCNLSTIDEKNLLLEIDHIIPISKGGITSEENLQTLCWKCNRSKGAKILTTQDNNI